jgi:hypothetical protein
MNDRQLLELAAKAAEIDYGWQHIFDDYEGCTADTWDWNPLTNDGDALCLAVKLHLNIFIGREGTGVNDGEIPLRNFPIAVEHHGDDAYAATCRAIVRAAAEIGRRMK